nr:MAG TPA: hypothetical protein [Caudoviricetes sp.]
MVCLNCFNGLECHASTAVAYICGTGFNFYENKKIVLMLGRLMRAT